MKRILLISAILAAMLLSACGTAITPAPAPASTPTPTYTLSVSVSPSGAGSVSPPGGKYESGLHVTLTANPASGNIFDYWDGAASGSSHTVTITMNSNKITTAHFKVVDTLTPAPTPTPTPAPAPAQNPPVIVAFSIEPVQVNVGGDITLLWNVNGADSVSIDQGIGNVPASGQKGLKAQATTTYTLTATNSNGTVNWSVTVTAQAPAPAPAPAPPMPPYDGYGPQLLEPSYDSSCSCIAPINFSWEPYGDTQEYRFEMSENADMGAPLVSTTTETTAYHQFTDTLKCNKRYYWRVMSTAPAPSEWSAVFSFSNGPVTNGRPIMSAII